MPKLKVFLIFSILTSALYGQEVNFEIIGKIDRVKKSKTISLWIEGQRTSSTINEDGSFRFSGNIGKPKEAQIQTDSSISTFLWIDNGTIKLNLKEEDRGRFINLRVMELEGPDDSYLYFYKVKSLQTLTLRGGTREQFTSLMKAKVSSFIDSVLQVRPASNVLPHYIRFFKSSLGVKLTGDFYNRLSPQQQASKDGTGIAHYLLQESVLKPGTVFQNFTISDTRGNPVELNNIKSGFILIDFWASWCGPCRANHPFLKEAYEKYAGKGLSIVSISLDDNRKEWLTAIQKDKMNWLNVSELKGWDGEITQRSKIYVVPYSVLLDQNKKILSLDLMGQDLLYELDKLFNK